MQLSPEAEARIFGPTPDLAPTEPEAPKADSTQADGGETPPSKEPEKPADPPPQARALFDAIKAEREAKEARAKWESEQDSLRKRAEEAEQKLQAVLKAKEDMLLDPYSYLKEMGYSDKDIALHGEAIMYTLMPDKAPEGLRGRLVEAQMQRDKAKQAKEAQEAQAKAQAERQAQLEQVYTAKLAEAVDGTPKGTYPDSESWFGQDRDAYVKSLFHTARNLAEAADRAGTQADLSPATVAKALEQDLNARLQRVRGVSAQQVPQKPATPVAPQDKLPEPKTEIPVQPPKALSEADRIKRATAAAFRKPE